MTNHEEPGVYYSSLEGRYLAREGVQLLRSLTGPALAFEGSIFAFRHNDSLVVRLGDAIASEAITAGHGTSYPGGTHRESGNIEGGHREGGHREGGHREGLPRAHAAWVSIPFAPADPHRFAHYMERAYENARSLVM